MWKQIGTICVDTGTIVVADPSSMNFDRIEESIFESFKNDPTAKKLGWEVENVGEKAPRCKSVVLFTGAGDGFYPVFAKFEKFKFWGKRITEIRIPFDVPED